MDNQLRYDPTAAHALVKKKHLKKIEEDLLAARAEVFADVNLLRSGDKLPKKKQPLDSGYIPLPAELLDEREEHPAASLLGRIEEAAEELRNRIDRLVLLGIGGSYMGTRALFEALCHRWHNELSREQRGGIPRLYFEGNNLDNDTISGLLDLLRSRCRNPRELAERWGIVVISKSGGTLETAAAFRIFREALEKFYGAGSEESRRFVVPITGEEGKLRQLSDAVGYPHVFPIPDGVGGRFSVLTAVGLFPAAMMGMDLRKLLQGAADMTERFRSASFGENPVLDYTAVCHLFERDQQRDIRVLSTWGNRLEALGLWYDQLLSESLGKEERGATPITVVNTRDLHSRGQQHQEGAPNKLITNLVVERPATAPVSLPRVGDAADHDQLNRFANKSVPDMLTAAIAGTNEAYAEAARPTTDVVLPRLDEYHLGELLQMLMLATVLEGRLIGINPYGQPGVEAYKRNMMRLLS